ncbi:hypothetical protein D9M70_387700 [compost metagenome]
MPRQPLCHLPGFRRQVAQVVDAKQLSQQLLDLAGLVAGNWAAVLRRKHAGEEGFRRPHHRLYAAVVGIGLAIRQRAVGQLQRYPGIVGILLEQVVLGLTALARVAERERRPVLLAGVLPFQIFLATGAAEVIPV